MQQTELPMNLGCMSLLDHRAEILMYGDTTTKHYKNLINLNDMQYRDQHGGHTNVMGLSYKKLHVSDISFKFYVFAPNT